MRILFLTQVLPYPLDAGPKVRAYYVLRHLAQSHEVTLVSFVRPSDKPESIEHLRHICTHVHTVPMWRSTWRDGLHVLQSLVMRTPFLIQRDWVPAMASKLKDIVACEGPFDAIHADQLWMAPYALNTARLDSHTHATTLVLDQHNAVYMIPMRLAQNERNILKRWLLRAEVQKLAQFEAKVCREFAHVVWVTHEDLDAVQAVPSDEAKHVVNSGVIPICVDPLEEQAVMRSNRRRRITFLGGLHYPPNAQGVVWFAKEVFPLVLHTTPDAVLTVIGRQPPEELSKLDIPSANLDITGYVDDPEPYLAETAAFLVPLHAGGGMRVKILDAWCWRLPMVSTTIGAEGIDVTAGKDILIADTVDDFAEATARLLCDLQLADDIACGGRRTVENHYNWRQAYQAWDRIYAGQPG